MTDGAARALMNRTSEIVDDARRRLNAEKGHSLCDEGCDCPDCVRLVEDYLIHSQKAIEKHGTVTTPMAGSELPDTEDGESGPEGHGGSESSD